MIRQLSMKNKATILLTQIIPWGILFAVVMSKPLALEAVAPYLNNKPAAIIISVSMAIIICFIMITELLINEIFLKKIDTTEIKINLILSIIHIAIVFTTIIVFYGNEDL